MIKRGMSLLLSSAAAVALSAGVAGTANAGASNCCDQVEELQRQNLLLQDEIAKLKSAQPAEEEKDILAVPGDLTFNAAITTDYSFRGISQTDLGPAVQAGFDWAMGVGDTPFGVYLGVWGSNVNFADGASSIGGVIELDAYGGVTYKVNDNFSLDLGAIGYLYPNANEDIAYAQDYEYYEIKFGGTYDFGYFSSDLYINYSPNYFLESGDFWYPNLSVHVPVTSWFGFDGNVGYSFISDNAQFGTKDYLDYGVGASLTLDGVVTLSVGYYGTDLNNGECFGGSTICDGRVIGKVSASL